MIKRLPDWVSLAGCKTPADKAIRIQHALTSRGYRIINDAARTKDSWGRGRHRQHRVLFNSVLAVQPDGRHVTFTFA